LPCSFSPFQEFSERRLTEKIGATEEESKKHWCRDPELNWGNADFQAQFRIKISAENNENPNIL